MLRQLQQARKDYEDSDSFAGFYDGFTDELAGLAETSFITKDQLTKLGHANNAISEAPRLRT